MKLTPEKDFKVVVGLLFIVLLPAVFTLRSIDVAREMIPVQGNPTPYGYTWSLGLFIVPIVAVAVWFHIKPRESGLRKAFYMTVLGLPLLGFFLDLFLGTLFFTFENRAATLGVWVGAWNWQEFKWLPDQLPLEEFVFYTSGVAAALCTYVWCDEYWLKAYKVPDEGEVGRNLRRIFQFHWGSLWIGVALILAAWLYKKFGQHPYHEGFPGYFTFMVVAAVVPSMLLFPSVKSVVNWRAMSFTGFMLLLISLLWEATLGVPYQWWGYRYDQMIGLTIGAWMRLPAEEPNLWLSVTYVTVIVYEAIKLWLDSQRSFRSAFFG